MLTICIGKLGHYVCSAQAARCLRQRCQVHSMDSEPNKQSYKYKI